MSEFNVAAEQSRVEAFLRKLVPELGMEDGRVLSREDADHYAKRLAETMVRGAILARRPSR